MNQIYKDMLSEVIKKSDKESIYQNMTDMLDYLFAYNKIGKNDVDYLIELAVKFPEIKPYVTIKIKFIIENNRVIENHTSYIERPSSNYGGGGCGSSSGRSSSRC